MLDRAQREAALQALVDRAVERPARLVEDPREPLQQDVADQDRERRRERGVVDAQVIDRGGEQQRHQGVHQGRPGEQPDGEPEADAKARLVPRPQQPQEAKQRVAIDAGGTVPLARMCRSRGIG